MLLKVCSKCSVEQPLEAFPKNKAGKNGRKSTCLLCSRKYWAENRVRLNALNKERRLSNLEERREKDRAYNASHAEERKQYHKKKYLMDREKRLAYVAKYRKEKADKIRADRVANREKQAAYESNRRAMKLNATPAWADLSKIQVFYDKAKVASGLYGSPFVVDHIVPLRSRLVCGLHVEHNLRVIPQSENCVKRNKLMPELLAA